MLNRLRNIGVALALLVVLTVPATASANVSSTYRNWGYVTPSDGTTWAPAFRWFDDWGWYGTSRARAERVWIQPFSGGWSWTWTSTSGWLAMRGTELSATQSKASAGIRGTVTYGPLCPVDPCDIQPSPVLLTFVQQVGIHDTPRIVQVWTGANGAYSATLPSGNWFVSANIGIGWSSYVTVPASEWVTRNFSIDSGIR